MTQAAIRLHPSNKPERTAARSKLHEAIERRDAAALAQTDALRAEQRAQSLVSDARAQLSAYDDLDGAIAAHHAGRKSKPVAANLDCLPILPSGRPGRNDARDALVPAEAALKLLSNELTPATDALNNATIAVNVAAQNVLLEESLPLAQELKAAREKSWLLADRLHALGGLWLSTEWARCRPVPLAHEVVTILNSSERTRGNRADEQAKSEDHTIRWKNYFNRLCADADASSDSLLVPAGPGASSRRQAASRRSSPGGGSLVELQLRSSRPPHASEGALRARHPGLGLWAALADAVERHDRIVARMDRLKGALAKTGNLLYGDGRCFG